MFSFRAQAQDLLVEHFQLCKQAHRVFLTDQTPMIDLQINRAQAVFKARDLVIVQRAEQIIRVHARTHVLFLGS